MIKHIVMFKLKDTPEHTAAENAAIAKAEAEKLRTAVPSLKEYEVVLNADNADNSNYNIALICLFGDMAGLAEYQQHPAHKEFGEFIYGLRTENGRACIDFEI
ncbi:MAG: Dabb family protein [Oscillospiraceae bacterium]|nr:Dabb family protein [Oscillospiraceae bacterium]